MSIPQLLPFGIAAASDLIRPPRIDAGPREALDAAVAWMKRAHDASPDGGVSYGYTLRGGWGPSYRETSGYIAVTFFDLAKQRGDEDAYERALEICRWIPSIQNPDGSISNPKFGPERGLIFDTGQVLLGLARAVAETGDERFQSAGEFASRWLVEVADAEGRWTKNTHKGVPHVYNARVAWALLRFNSLVPIPDAERVARANLDWAASCRRDGGFDECAFERGPAPFTHTIAYVIRGLLESGLLLEDEGYLEAAALGARDVMKHLRHDGFLPGQISADGRAVGAYSCLTGNCQMAIIWHRLWTRTGDQAFLDAAISTLEYVMACQDVRHPNPAIRGAIKGSHPIWGRYAGFSYPNWATKFFIDAMQRCEGALATD